MVRNIDHFEYIVTDSEAEALILECNLIKKNMPKFNVLLKDDKTYPYIKIDLASDYPNVFITRRLKNDGSKNIKNTTGKNNNGKIFIAVKTVSIVPENFIPTMLIQDIANSNVASIAKTSVGDNFPVMIARYPTVVTSKIELLDHEIIQ